MKKLLVVVDYQTDFVTGALANPLAQPLEPAIASTRTPILTAKHAKANFCLLLIAFAAPRGGSCTALCAPIWMAFMTT